MKVVIKGRITPERISDIFKEIEETHKKHLKGIYGGSLYLQFFGEDGEPFALVNEYGVEQSMVFETPADEQPKPPLSAAAIARKEILKSVRAQEKIDADKEDAAREKRRREDIERRNAERRAVLKTTEYLNERTAEIWLAEGNRFLDELNDSVAEAWKKFDPRMKSGKNKGEARPIPEFSAADGRLLFKKSADQRAVKIGNPLLSSNEKLIENVDAWDHFFETINSKHYPNHPISV